MMFAAVGAALALGISMIVPKKYEAVVEILVDQKMGVPNVALSNADQSIGDVIDFGRPRSLTTQVTQLTSGGVLSVAATKVAQERNLPNPLSDPSSPLYPLNIKDQLSVSAEATSDIIGLSIKMTDPEMAKSVAREIYLAFVDQNQTNTRQLADGAIKFLEKQVEEEGGINSQIKDVDSKVEALKTQLGTPDINTQIQADIANLNTLRASRDAAVLDFGSARRRREQLERSVKEIDARMDQGKVMTPNPVYQKLQGDLISAQADLSTQMTRYTEDREEVKAAKSKVELITKQLGETPKEIKAQTSEGPNTNRTQLVSALEDAKASEAAYGQRVQDANAAVSEKESYLKQMPEAQKTLADLNRQQGALERIYAAYQDRLKTLKAAGQGRVTPTREVTPATVYVDPVSPKPLINTIFGIVAGLIFGVLSMLATEAKRQPVRSLAQLNQLAFRPVYRLVPELRAPFRGISKAPPESFETLLANHLRSTTRPYRVAVVGLTKDAGASTAAINLAIAGGRHGSRVLLVGCDPRGGVARLAGRQPAEGEVVEISSLVKAMQMESFLSISAERNPEISPAIREHEADLTIVDLEPASKSAEYAFVAPHVDEVILLVRAGRTKSVEFLQAQQALKEAGCPQVTVAFTRSTDLAVVTDAADPSLYEENTSKDYKALDS